MKNRLRKEFIEKRDAMDTAEVVRKSMIIIDKLRKDDEYIQAKTIMFYVSKDNEVQTHNLIKEAMKNKRVIVPKVADNGVLCCELKDFGNMEFSCYGILEPKNEVICNISEIDLIIVPGIVFDKRGHRIGYGGGYYDNLLRKAKAKKIGLAFDFQIIDTIPNDDWDVRVDKVISDKV